MRAIILFIQIDCIVVKVCQDGSVVNKVVFPVPGGQKEPSGISRHQLPEAPPPPLLPPPPPEAPLLPELLPELLL